MPLSNLSSQDLTPSPCYPICPPDALIDVSVKGKVIRPLSALTTTVISSGGLATTTMAHLRVYSVDWINWVGWFRWVSLIDRIHSQRELQGTWHAVQQTAVVLWALQRQAQTHQV